MGHEIPLPNVAQSLTILDWEKARLAAPAVTSIRRVVTEDGKTRKSPVAAEVVQRGGGHLCPWEVYAFFGPEMRRNRITTGFTVHRGFLHVYHRKPPLGLEGAAKAALDEASHVFIDVAKSKSGKSGKSVIPPMPQRPPPPLPSPLVVRAAFAGSEYGVGYLVMDKGEHIILRSPPDGTAAEGWAYGLLLERNTFGWFPPSYATLCH